MELSEKTPLKEDTEKKFHLFMRSFSELLLSSKNLVYLLAIGFIETLGILSVLAGLSIYLSSVRRIPDVVVGVIIASYGLSNLFYSLFLGSLIDRYGLKRSLILGNLSALVGLVVFACFENIYVQACFLLRFISIRSLL